MAATARTLHRINNTVTIYGSFTTNGTGTPEYPGGLGYSVAYSATGVYTVTLDDKYNRLVGCVCSLLAAATSEQRVSHTATTLGDDDDAATLVFSMSLGATDSTAETPVEFNYAASAASDGDIVSFVATFIKTDSYGTV